MAPLTDRVRQVVAAVFNLPVAQVADTAGPLDTPGWDSLGHAQLIFALEEEFALDLPADVTVELQSVDAIAEYLAGRAPDARR